MWERVKLVFIVRSSLHQIIIYTTVENERLPMHVLIGKLRNNKKGKRSTITDLVQFKRTVTSIQQGRVIDRAISCVFPVNDRCQRLNSRTIDM